MGCGDTTVRSGGTGTVDDGITVVVTVFDDADDCCAKADRSSTLGAFAGAAIGVTGVGAASVFEAVGAFGGGGAVAAPLADATSDAVEPVFVGAADLARAAE